MKISEETKGDVKLVTALLVLALLGLSAGLSPIWRAEPAGGEDLASVTGAIFGKWVLAFELLSALLLTALFGAVVIALRDPEAP